jgi:hypothetical protein
MNFSFRLFTTLFMMTVIAGCAGDQAELEEASYMLAQGGTENGSAVVAMLEAKLATATGETAFELNRLYAGAQMQVAGFDGVTMISRIVHKTESNTIAQVRSAVSLNGSSASALSAAITQLNAFVASTTFTDSTDTRAKDGIRFQLGLANFFESLRNSFTSSGLNLTSGSITSAQCVTNFAGQVHFVSEVNTNLSSAHTSFLSSHLDEDNPLVKLVQEFQNNVPNKDLSQLTTADITTICNYLAAQSQL